MAKYRVIKGFYDLEDPEGQSYHLYDKGDEYPRDGLNPAPERIAFLMSDSTKLLEPVIEEVPEADEEPAGEPAEETAEDSAEETAEAATEPQEAPKRRKAKK